MDFEKYVQIRTDSAPKGNSIMMMGLASKRMLEINEDVTLDEISTIIATHYKESGGKIELFGNITGYSLILSDDDKSIDSKLFGTAGNFIEDERIEHMDA